MARLAFTKLMLILSVLGLVIMPMNASLAQLQQVDPNDVIGQVPDESELPSASDVREEAQERLPSRDDIPNVPDIDVPDVNVPDGTVPEVGAPDIAAPNGTIPSTDPIGEAQRSTTYQQDDVIAAATGVFGKGAEGLASIVEDIFKKQGEPNGYIVGREGGAALVFGLRYGSGTLFHKIEGERPVYWNGPSIGFDAGANAASTFVLVYNLYDSEDLYRRYPAGEGAAYLIGGFNASYLRRGDVVLIPIRLGVGARLGVNAGYMKFRKKRKILPF